MDRDREPEVVDLNRYKKAVQAQAKRKAAPAPAREPLLGSRPRAGLILLAVIAAAVLLWAASGLH